MDADDPISRFRSDLERVSGTEPLAGTACVLATVDERGMPSARVVLLKEADERGFVFFTNYESRKAGQLEANPRAALCFHWPSVEEQVRVAGAVERVSEAESNAYFATRPRESQIGAWASAQSQPLPSRAELERRFEQMTRRFGEAPIPRPPGWGGYRLLPERIEFWSGRPHRLHDRQEYLREGQGWSVRSLYP